MREVYQQQQPIFIHPGKFIYNTGMCHLLTKYYILYVPVKEVRSIKHKLDRNVKGETEYLSVKVVLI